MYIRYIISADLNLCILDVFWFAAWRQQIVLPIITVLQAVMDFI